MKIRHIVLATLLLPFIEFWVFGLVAAKLGVLPSLALLIALSFAGFALLKSEGKRFLESLKRGETVQFSSEAARHGVRTGLGGLLLAMPGFLSDILAFFCLIPYFKSFFTGERTLTPAPTSPNVIDLTPEQWHETLEGPPANPSPNAGKNPSKNPSLPK
jgi:UPF0716 protein FxsA